MLVSSILLNINVGDFFVNSSDIIARGNNIRLPKFVFLFCYFPQTELLSVTKRIQNHQNILSVFFLPENRRFLIVNIKVFVFGLSASVTYHMTKKN